MTSNSQIHHCNLPFETESGFYTDASGLLSCRHDGRQVFVQCKYVTACWKYWERLINQAIYVSCIDTSSASNGALWIAI